MHKHTRAIGPSLGTQMIAGGDFNTSAKMGHQFYNLYDVVCERDIYHFNKRDGKRIARKMLAQMPVKNSWFYRDVLKNLLMGERKDLTVGVINQLGARVEDLPLPADGHEYEIRWEEHTSNLVVNEGLDDNLSAYFTLVSPEYIPAFYVGLTDGTPTIAATDTLSDQSPEKGWVEVVTYLNSPDFRPDLVLGAVSGQSVDNTGSVAVFNINGSATIGGAFVARIDATKGGDLDSPQLGILYGAAAFTGGDRGVQNNDTLNVTVTLTASSS